jgi:hypothetical protein
MSVVAIPRTDEWVSGCEAKRISGLTWYMLHKHVMLGKVRALAEPGSLIKYNKPDLERLVSERPDHKPIATGSKPRSDVTGSKSETRGAINTRVSVASCLSHAADTRGPLKPRIESTHASSEF